MLIGALQDKQKTFDPYWSLCQMLLMFLVRSVIRMDMQRYNGLNKPQLLVSNDPHISRGFFRTPFAMHEKRTQMSPGFPFCSVRRVMNGSAWR